ncbi:hypothetical protein IFM89_009717 [Coptis chinensis]|uniref:ER membrane protein complex subunit 3 n=1 Tax=Coptis chinensis TaxID=261450 RepID=A0A835HBP8_9MAGN|nr:hypothetical protein IFM89_009717 [Coptis chinensis]
MGEDLVLDTAIRDWVLIPLSLVMVLTGIFRYFVSKLMRSSQLPTDPKIVKKGQIVVRARNLRASANFIPIKSFRNWRAYFSNEENGLLHVPKGQAQNAQAQMFFDPNMAMDMMKKNLSMIIPQGQLLLSYIVGNPYFCVGQLLLLRFCSRDYGDSSRYVSLYSYGGFSVGS